MNPEEQSNQPVQEEAQPPVQPPEAPAEIPENNQVDNNEEIVDDAPVNWTAAEYIHVEKNGLWYLIFSIVAMLLIASDVFFIKSYTFTILIVVIVIAVIVYSKRPPQVIQYTLSEKQGLYLGEKLYPYSNFKSFGVVKDGEHQSIILIPTKRFAQSVTVYFPDEMGEVIVDILGARLPMKPLQLDTIDQIVRKLRL